MLFKIFGTGSNSNFTDGKIGRPSFNWLLSIVVVVGGGGGGSVGGYFVVARCCQSFE